MVFADGSCVGNQEHPSRSCLGVRKTSAKSVLRPKRPRFIVTVECKVKPIYDRFGRAVGWLRGNNLYSRDGRHVAVIRSMNVYGHRGQHLGVFYKGFFRDPRGGAVAFVEGAKGGPLLPITSIPPIPPIPSIPPVPAIPSIPPIPAIPSFGWGQQWSDFISK